MSLTHTPETVNLSRAYEDPVVLARPVSYNGPDVSVIRITDVQSDQFTMYVDEAPNHDGGHTTETVSYIVAESGAWTLANGDRLEVGRIATDAEIGRGVTNTFDEVRFRGSFAATPAILSQVQGELNPHWVTTRQTNPQSHAFDVALQEDEASTASHSGLSPAGGPGLPRAAGLSP